MIYAFIAGALNALGTLYLKMSTKSLINVLFSILFYGMNFYFFRNSLQLLKPSTAYCLLIISTLLFLKVFEIVATKEIVGFNEMFGLIFFLIAIYLFR